MSTTDIYTYKPYNAADDAIYQAAEVVALAAAAKIYATAFATAYINLRKYVPTKPYNSHKNDYPRTEAEFAYYACIKVLTDAKIAATNNQTIIKETNATDSDRKAAKDAKFFEKFATDQIHAKKNYAHYIIKYAAIIADIEGNNANDADDNENAETAYFRTHNIIP